jgi:septin family protein
VATRLFLAVGMTLAVGGAAFSLRPALPPASQFERPQVQQSQAEKDMMDRQIREANKKRQQDIRNDTEKLFQLATELRTAVDKTNENLLSLEVVRKAEEVEKLAHRVKEKMKESVGPPLNADPIPPRPR